MKSLEAASQNTVDSIFLRQNDPLLIDCLVAQKNEYTKAKKLQAFASGTIIVLAIVSAIASAVDVEWLTAVVGLISVLMLVLKKCVYKEISARKQDAASIQQVFDVVLFAESLGNRETEWNNFLGRKWVSQMIGENPGTGKFAVRNWYSNYSTLSNPEQVFCCQKENIRWSKRLLREYQILQICFWSLVVLAVIACFFVANPSFIKFICVCTWLVPVADYAIESYCAIRDCYSQHINLEKYTDTIDYTLITVDSEETTQCLIDLQQKIYETRCSDILIPDWFYNWRKSKHQRIEDNIAKKMRNY